MCLDVSLHRLAALPPLHRRDGRALPFERARTSIARGGYFHGRSRIVRKQLLLQAKPITLVCIGTSCERSRSPVGARGVL